MPNTSLDIFENWFGRLRGRVYGALAKQMRFITREGQHSQIPRKWHRNLWFLGPSWLLTSQLPALADKTVQMQIIHKQGT